MTRYEALAGEVESAIRAGVMRPGDRLPSVRQAARTHRASLSTVFQAYYLLEARGLVVARERSGYYVAPPQAVLPRLREPSRPDGAARPVDISETVFDLLATVTRPGMLPLGSPFPDPALFPLAQLGRAMGSAARGLTPRSTLEDLSPGKEALRRQIALRYVADGIPVHHDDIVITNGALEALNLCLATVARPGDTIVVESPAFYGALQALERVGMRAVEVATCPCDGIDLGALERAIRQHKPKACWLMPTFHNPLGATMPDERKAQLVALLARHGLPLIEDDVYGELHFSAARVRPAKAWDIEGLVLHCSSFSKCLAPGYRIGWVAAGRFGREIARHKFTTTLMASMPAQLGLASYLQRGGYERHLRKLRQALAAQYRDMAHAIARHFPEGTCATQPEGGYFLWVDMPGGVDAWAMQRFAAVQGISLAPGPIFSAARSFRNCIRLNFGHPFTDRTERAIELLGRYAREQLRKPAVAAVGRRRAVGAAL